MKTLTIALILATTTAQAAQTFTGTWATSPALCGAPAGPERPVLTITPTTITGNEWGCRIRSRVGSRVNLACSDEGTESTRTETWAMRGDRLRIDRHEYVRCAR